MKIRFDLKRFVEALFLALDFAELDYFKINLNHSRRVAYISLMIGKKIELEESFLKDLYILAGLHDNGVTLQSLHLNNRDFEFMPAHCLQGERNLKNMPFINNCENIIKYHHENYNGSGTFRLKGGEIPLLSQIISFSDTLDRTFNLTNIPYNQRTEIKNFVKQNKNILFNPMISDAFLDLAKNERIWADLNFNNISYILDRIAPEITYEYEWAVIIKLSEIFMKIIDSKSKFTFRHSLGISEKTKKMCEFYNFSEINKIKMIIAANLHDLGKLYIPNAILDKPGLLNLFEFQEMKQHTYYTKLALEKIPEFQDIAKWAANHHEKLNGLGYPEGLTADELDFQSRIIAVVDIYQALTEERPYRKSLEHKKVIEIMQEMANKNFIDKKILSDLDEVILS